MEYHHYHPSERRRKPAAERIPCGPPPSWYHRPGLRRDIACFKIIKHVEFTTLIRQTTDDDPLVRKDAFEGIMDYIRAQACLRGNDDKDKETIFKQLCNGISDTDDCVRESAYKLLEMIKDRQNFEDYAASLLFPSVMEALANTEIGVHQTGKKVYDLLVHQIPSCIHVFIRKAIKNLEDMMKNDVDEQQGSHLHKLRIFQSVNVCLSSMPSLPSSDQCYAILFDKKSLGVLKSVLSAFPMDSEHFDIDIEVMKIFLRLPKLSDSEKFLAFINDKLHKITESNLEELLAFFPPYVPMLVADLGSHSQANLIQAFTVGFKRSLPESAFKSACVAAIEQMLLGSFAQDVNSELFQHCRREWLEELNTLVGRESRCTSHSSQNLKKRLPLVMSILRSSGDSE